MVVSIEAQRQCWFNLELPKLTVLLQGLTDSLACRCLGVKLQMGRLLVNAVIGEGDLPKETPFPQGKRKVPLCVP